MECGHVLVEKYLENEGMIPYCEHCQEFRFPMFNVGVSMIVKNHKDEVLLIKQYGKDRYVLVAGYVNICENAEHAAIREVKEEIGLDVVDIYFNKSEYYQPTNTLMFNFECLVESDDLSQINEEVDEAKWFDQEEILDFMKCSLAKKFLSHWLEKHKRLK